MQWHLRWVSTNTFEVDYSTTEARRSQCGLCRPLLFLSFQLYVRKSLFNCTDILLQNGCIKKNI